MYLPEDIERLDFSLMANFINIMIYGILLILLESGYVKQFINYIKVKCLIKESNITFSNLQISEEFLFNNNYFEEGNTPFLRCNKAIFSETSNDINNESNNNCIEKEKSKINSDVENKLTTKIIALKKTYWSCCGKSIRAVNNLYLGLDNNVKFVLLGFNGSGKTTTFKAITREILYESGTITLFGQNVKTEFNQIRKYIGYCPQENPLFNCMKVKEIIKFYLSLKDNNNSVQTICNKIGLDKYLDIYFYKLIRRK